MTKIPKSRPVFKFQGELPPRVERLREGESVTEADTVVRVVSPPAADEPTQPSMRVADTQVHLETAVRDGHLIQFGYSLRNLFERIAAEWHQAKLTVTLALTAGVVIGLPILGWWLWPVEWTNSTYAELAPSHQQAIIDMATDLYSLQPMNPSVIRFVYLYPDIQIDTCELAETAVDPSVQARRRQLAFKVSGQDCQIGQ